MLQVQGTGLQGGPFIIRHLYYICNNQTIVIDHTCIIKWISQNVMVVTCKVFIAKDLLIHTCYTWLRTFYSRCSAVKMYLFRDSFSPLNIVVSINHAISVITIIEMSSAGWLQIFQVNNFIGNTFFYKLSSFWHFLLYIRRSSPGLRFTKELTTYHHITESLLHVITY